MKRHVANASHQEHPDIEHILLLPGSLPAALYKRSFAQLIVMPTSACNAPSCLTLVEGCCVTFAARCLQKTPTNHPMQGLGLQWKLSFSFPASAVTHFEPKCFEVWFSASALQKCGWFASNLSNMKRSKPWWGEVQIDLVVFGVYAEITASSTPLSQTA